MNNLNDHGKPSLPTIRTETRWLIASAFACVLFGAFLGWGVHMLWQLDDTPVTSTLKEQMMHRKTRTMEQILDGLVRGRMGNVEDSALQMNSIGAHLNWYSSSDLYENNNETFRDSTAELIEAAGRRDYDAAKEAALRLERSCIECHALINSRSQSPSSPRT